MKTLKISFLVLILSAAAMSFTNFNSIQTTVNHVLDDLITWKSDTIEVGEIPQGTPYTIKFEFKNTTKKPVVITNVKAQCGCTATDYSKEPIKPKKSGYVNAIFNAAHAGTFTKTVTVTTSDSDAPKKLTFKGTVIEKK